MAITPSTPATSEPARDLSSEAAGDLPATAAASNDATTNVVAGVDVAGDATWLTLTEIARRLGRPPSTVSYWRNAFRAEIEERTDDERHPCYRLAVFERIDGLMRQRAERSEIRQQIAGPIEEPTEGFESSVLARLDRVIEILEVIAARLDRSEPS